MSSGEFTGLPPATLPTMSGTPVLDVMRVPATGDPSRAVLRFDAPARMREETCDLLVVGGGTGGTAAALAASRAGLHVALIEETAWIGGQFTAQGVSALDEHEHIEQFGGTRSYMALREGIRRRYQSRYPAAAAVERLNPGNCWVTRLAFEPRVALDVLDEMLAPAVRAGRLAIATRRKAVAVERTGDRIDAVLSVGLDDGAFVRHRFRRVIDATETGDLLALAGVEHVVGAESQAETGEPDAHPTARQRRAVQSLTYPVALRLDPGGRPGAPPPRYVENRDGQPYSLRIHVRGGEIYGEVTGTLEYDVFEQRPGTKGGLWTYRRLVDAALLGLPPGGDLSIFNWPGNDYRGPAFFDQAPEEAATSLQQAKWVSLGFLHWIRTEAPRAGGGRSGAGYPEIVPAPDVYGTHDALPMYPYIREGRRIVGLTHIVEQDVSVEFQRAARARLFDDSVGVGWYPIDIHAANADDTGISTRTRPFQIPLGALVPRDVSNLLAGAKNIGTTHITNGCYRLHPVEWNAGEAAGLLAAFSIERDCLPHDVSADARLTRAFQAELAQAGVPLFWFTDVGVDAPGFAALQTAAVAGELTIDPDDLHACRLPAAERARLGIDQASCA